MHIHRCAASIAQFEFYALVQDTKNALGGLKRQHESVVQALETARHTQEGNRHWAAETDAQVARLEDSLQRLDAALDQVMCEIRDIEATSSPLSDKPFIVLPLPSVPRVERRPFLHENPSRRGLATTLLTFLIRFSNVIPT
jgi:septal ring factor EnvC (AmiA/AmiB activator)